MDLYRTGVTITINQRKVVNEISSIFRMKTAPIYGIVSMICVLKGEVLLIQLVKESFACNCSVCRLSLLYRVKRKFLKELSCNRIFLRKLILTFVHVWLRFMYYVTGLLV